MGRNVYENHAWIERIFASLLLCTTIPFKDKPAIKVFEKVFEQRKNQTWG